jgi:hypothetical protein
VEHSRVRRSDIATRLGGGDEFAIPAAGQREQGACHQVTSAQWSWR